MKPTNQPGRVVITGLGVITSIGESVPQFSAGLFEGKCGIEPVTLFDASGFHSETAGQIQRMDLRAAFDPADVKRASRCDLLGMIAADEAMSDSGIEAGFYHNGDCGIIMGGGAGGMLSWEKHRRAVWRGQPNSTPSRVLAASPCTITDILASRYHLAGSRATISTACSSSTTALGYASDLIRSGDQKMIMAGGSESLSLLTFAGFNSLRATDPLHCRPFDKNRKGLTLGEGAAVFVLEDYAAARRRGAKIYAEILGYAINSDAYHLTSPDPKAEGMTRVMIKAMENAGIEPQRVGYINAHGTGTRLNDRLETLAIRQVFGNRADKLSVSSTKSQVGHCLGASGAVEAMATAIAIWQRKIPPTVHLSEPDPECDLDYVAGGTKSQEIDVALSNSFAFGGNNSSLVLGAVA